MINSEANMLAAMAQLLLKKGDASAEQRWSLADRCRSAGALEAARALLEGEGLSSPALALRSALAGVRLTRTVSTQPGQPEPIFVEDDWLSKPVIEKILSIVKSRIPQLVSSEVYDGEYVGVDPSTRRSLVVKDNYEIAAAFLPHLRNLLPPEPKPFLGVVDRNLERVELQVTQHGNGAFFKPHSDAGRHKDSTRKLSYVYYFRFVESAFSGGDLRIFDGDPMTGKWSSSSFTTVAPKHNRLVMFPSTAIHEVTPVESASLDPLAGRFSVNGWIH